MWISNTLYTSKFFVLVFDCHTYLTLGSLCFILYIGTAHYSILHFLVFFLSTCLATFFACIMCSRLQHYILQMNPALLSSSLETNAAIWTHYNCLSLPCSAASSFWCKLYFVMTELYLFFSWSWNSCSMSKFRCMNWLVLLKLQN